MQQRKRWARGQGEVLRTHFATALRWRNRRIWLVAIEAAVALIWVLALLAALALTVWGFAVHESSLLGFGLEWGIALAVIGTLQVTVALLIGSSYDPGAWRAFLIERSTRCCSG